MNVWYKNDDKPLWENIATPILNSSPIWIVNSGVFRAEPMKLICTRIFNHLPYYKIEENGTLLENGVTVPDEITYVDKIVPLDFSIEVLVCEGNEVALEIALEIQDASPPQFRDGMRINLVQNDDMVQEPIDPSEDNTPPQQSKHVSRGNRKIAVNDW